MLSKDNTSFITCSKVAAAGFTFRNVSIVTLTNLTFIGCGNDSRYNAVLHISQVTDANISMCVFLHSKGRAIEAAHVNITTRNCSFQNSSAGVIIAEYNTTILDIGSIYTLNSYSTVRSALVFINRSVANFISSRFYENNVVKTNVMHVKRCILTLRQCELAHNNGGLLISYNSTIAINDSNLIHNFAFDRISLLRINTTNLSIDNSIFAHNVGQRQLTILSAVKDNIVKSHNTLTITNNTCKYYLYCRYAYFLDIQSSRVTFGIAYFSDNTGSMQFLRSKVKFIKLKFQQARSILPDIHRRPLYRGAITSLASIIQFQGTTSFCNQDTQSAVYAIESRIYANGDTLFSNNAGELGGALYLDQSDFICKKNCTFIGNTAKKGGGIYAINSIITIGSVVT
jgi:predicted outer membrane repeat protein